MIAQIRRTLKHLPNFLHKHIGFGTILTLSFMGIIVLFSPVFVQKAEQAAIPAFLDSVSGYEALNIERASFLGDSSPVYEASEPDADDFSGHMTLEGGSVVNSPVTTDYVWSSNGSLVYKISKGDSISVLARRFNIPASVIIAANNLNKSGLVRLGQEIIIPNTKPVQNATNNDLPDFKKYFSMPVKDGLNLGKLYENSVDILAACGAPIYASAEGYVEEVSNPDEWTKNGVYLKIKHSFADVETIYAHNSKNLVEVGDVVSAGEKIAEVGNTGENTQGVSGCHVSFGVVGAKNPFTK